MRASDPLKSKRLAISLLAWSTALRTSIASLSETTSNVGMAVPPRRPAEAPVGNAGHCRPSRGRGAAASAGRGSAAGLQRLPALERGDQLDLDRGEALVHRPRFGRVAAPGRGIG